MATQSTSKVGRNTAVGGGVVGIILAVVFALEGGYVNNPKDPGGATNHGITEQVARNHGYKGSMKDLSKDAAASIYYDDYIKAPRFDLFLDVSPAVAEKLVDAGVNTGTTRPSRWLQQSLNSLNRDGKDFPLLTVDGKVGPATLAAYKRLQTVRGEVRACELTLKLLDSYQAQHYVSLTNLKTFTPGWIDHRIGNVPLSKCKNYGDVFNVPERDR
ncbi:SAR endolysin N-acetylmuramidase [Stenotrophomonas phage Philippe]|uniref:SAR endolysin N-acetylmuramidase n=1 Tax=Stenotrophomonas phage Philippe TaxID=2859655 RepID=A0AAE7WMX5_9CAUD|nr:SAR endolysin N-acetylmuramidase [Stenotrophomonas phage Philippe]QYW02282.1 SAR endolysin N-acetylmuramidase [Stenotrophomonas phage Philippe]